MSTRALALGSLAAMALFSGCSDDELLLTVNDFEPLGPNFAYGVWMLEGDDDDTLADVDVNDAELVAIMNVRADGTPVFVLEEEGDDEDVNTGPNQVVLDPDVDEDEAVAMFITLEPISGLTGTTFTDTDGDGLFDDNDFDDTDVLDQLSDGLLNDLDDRGITGRVIVAGEFVGNTADIDVAHPLALGDDFADISGSYVLVTPTTADETDYDQGIWWMNETQTASTLDLPVLPAGFQYVNWLETPTGVINLGSFTDPSSADSNGAGPDAGTDAAPGFPGEDFIDPALVVVGNSTYTTIEPIDDPLDSPSGLRILEDGDITDVGRLVLQDMSSTVGTFLPTATAVYIDND